MSISARESPEFNLVFNKEYIGTGKAYLCIFTNLVSIKTT